MTSALFACREVPSETTGFSPFELLYGRAVRGPMRTLKGSWVGDKTDTDTQIMFQICSPDLQIHVDWFRQRPDTRFKKCYDHKARTRSYSPGDHVLILLPTNHNKLLLQWKGSFKIVQAVSPYDYKLEIKNGSKIFHANMLKKYVQKRDWLPVASSTNITEQKHPRELLLLLNEFSNIFLGEPWQY